MTTWSVLMAAVMIGVDPHKGLAYGGGDRPG
jgi:hypothetical protein